MYGIYIYTFHVQPQLRGIVATWDLPPEKTQPNPNPPGFTCTSIANDLNITNLLGGKIGVLGAGTKNTLQVPWMIPLGLWMGSNG